MQDKNKNAETFAEEQEVWKDLEGYYETIQVKNKMYSRPLYKISSFGRIMSDSGQGCREITPQINAYDQKVVTLIGKNTSKKTTSEVLGRLIAKHFIPNPNGYNHIRFKDGDSMNCKASNIEWTNLTERQKNQYENSKKKINQYTLGGKYIRSFNSLQDAEVYFMETEGKTVYKASISSACRTYRKYFDSQWRYESEVKAGEDIRPYAIKETISFYQIDKKTGKILKKFGDIEEVAAFLGKKSTDIQANIHNCCMGKRPTAYGYIWKEERTMPEI